MSQDSLKRAMELQADAAKLGFDWPTLEGMLEKLHEELEELRKALQASPDSAAVQEELGDLLFVLLNLARRLELDPNTVLQQASDKFERRFAYVRDTLILRGQQPEAVDLDVMEALWQEAKRRERLR